MIPYINKPAVSEPKRVQEDPDLPTKVPDRSLEHHGLSVTVECLGIGRKAHVCTCKERILSSFKEEVWAEVWM